MEIGDRRLELMKGCNHLGIRDQFIRAALSIPSNIAEGTHL
jgi:four helix bundle protein